MIACYDAKGNYLPDVVYEGDSRVCFWLPFIPSDEGRDPVEQAIAYGEKIKRILEQEKGMALRVQGWRDAHMPGLDFTTNASPAPSIPPLPDHPRFRKGITGHEFAINHCQWPCITKLTDYELESACCIARCWWLDYASSVERYSGYGAGRANADAWRDYLESRRGAA